MFLFGAHFTDDWSNLVDCYCTGDCTLLENANCKQFTTIALLQ